MGTAITTIARWETTRPPKGRWLARLVAEADRHNLADLAQFFSARLSAELTQGLEQDASGLVDDIQRQVRLGQHPIAYIPDQEDPSTHYLVTSGKDEVLHVGQAIRDLWAGKGPEEVSAELGEPLEAIRALHTAMQPTVGERNWVAALLHLLRSDLPDVRADSIRILYDLRDAYEKERRLAGGGAEIDPASLSSDLCDRRDRAHALWSKDHTKAPDATALKAKTEGSQK